MSSRIVIERGARRSFASAIDWPGWSRWGRTPDEALATLKAYRARYAVVPAEANVPFGDDVTQFEVIEEADGNATTDFGAPAIVAEAEGQPLTAQQSYRMASLVSACWAVFDRVVVGAPAELAKGPRGGGRDRDAVVDHVQSAELAYYRKIGIRLGKDLGASRAAFVQLLGAQSDGTALDASAKGWPPRYAARRVAWHVLDHAWEIEDKS